LGVYKYAITTGAPEAQAYFNQGLILAYSFNHAQAERSFLAGTERDPTCAMCYWGAAYSLGPNINAPMSAEAEAKALEYIEKAKSHAMGATPKERDFISAMAKRYATPAGQDRRARDRAFEIAMRDLARKYPDDPEAATIWAEAMMVQHPWNYWEKSGKARPWTPRIVEALETTIERFPDHPGAHHYYVHAMEASPFPEKAVASADKLNTLVPAAGHLVHMPAHIYIRVGRYQDAINANLAAIEADKNQVAQSPGLYSMMYKPHNHHFLWAAATLAGQRELATKAALDTANYMRDHEMKEPAMALMKQHFELSPLFNEVRFGMWDAILSRGPVNPEDPPYVQGMHAYARALALVKTGSAFSARPEITRLDELRHRPELENLKVSYNDLTVILDIARHIASGERWAALGEPDRAIRLLEEAKEMEDRMTYAEPADWHHPVRHILGRIYLEANQPRLALQAYREDLRTYPDNVWSRTGVAQANAMLREEDSAVATDSDLPASSF
jgi:tetratricopeptide (TPR) repeat protein